MLAIQGLRRRSSGMAAPTSICVRAQAASNRATASRGAPGVESPSSNGTGCEQTALDTLSAAVVHRCRPPGPLPVELPQPPGWRPPHRPTRRRSAHTHPNYLHADGTRVRTATAWRCVPSVPVGAPPSTARPGPSASPPSPHTQEAIQQHVCGRAAALCCLRISSSAAAPCVARRA